MKGFTVVTHNETRMVSGLGLKAEGNQISLSKEKE